MNEEDNFHDDPCIVRIEDLLWGCLSMGLLTFRKIVYDLPREILGCEED